MSDSDSTVCEGKCVKFYNFMYTARAVFAMKRAFSLIYYYQLFHYFVGTFDHQIYQLSKG